MCATILPPLQKFEIKMERISAPLYGWHPSVHQCYIWQVLPLMTILGNFCHYVNVRISIIADFGTCAAHVQVMTVLFCVRAGTTLESGYWHVLLTGRPECGLVGTRIHSSPSIHYNTTSPPQRMWKWAIKYTYVPYDSLVIDNTYM